MNQFILDSQKEFQKRMGHDLDNMTLQEKATYIKTMMLWTIDELSEALHELPYAKEWSSKYEKEDYDLEKQHQLFKEEIIDALHFFTNILIAAQMTEEEILKLYKEKNRLNYRRQEDPKLGYVRG
ncbi:MULTISPECIES: dUTPase [Bacillus]|uniref:dUTPase n=1 Tax=Bacillus TaxID=1386 RepID=UPI001967C325|nr:MULTISPECIES: dUTPase [Bacillus]QRZ95043.1 dUTPase [Bacillus sp. LJBS06]